MDGRVALLEVVYVIIAIHMGREGAVLEDRALGAETHRAVGRPPVPVANSDANWLQLDQVSHVEELPTLSQRQVAREFQFRTPRMVQSQVGGQRRSWNQSLETVWSDSCHAVAQAFRACSVGAERVDEFARG